jgi:neutral ceramidase
MPRTLTLFPLLAMLAACPGSTDTDAEPGPDYPDLVAGAPLAGAAEGTLKLPAGTPLSGFTSRCGCLGGTSRQDDRDSAYTTGFVESTGVHVRPTIKAVWISNGDQHMVMTKVDVIYAFDGFTEALTNRLEELTGEDLHGKVTFSGNHNHSSYGTYSDHEGLYLGSDKFNLENFTRMVEQVAAVAHEAYQSRKAAAIGIGWEKDWDPQDRVYSDRRGDNNDLVVWPDMGPEQSGKDPYMTLWRIDDAFSGEPISVIMSWGMHPYTFGERVPLATADATSSVESEVAEAFDNKVVAMFLQSSAGDASVRGSGDSDYARMESVGILARDAVLALREATPTSSEPLLIESFQRSIPMNLDVVKVRRDGAVNWYYPPYDPEREADDIVYDEQGKILSPLDEFNTDFGAAFCGSGDFDVPVGGMPTDAPEYTACMNVSLLKGLVQGFFRLSPEDVTLPMDGMESVYAGAARLGPLPVRYADGTTATEDALVGFFPGESTHMFVEQWRRRSLDELGYRNALHVAYSLDHEGYLLLPEDWLRGGYEPDISFWGPLAAEYIMEQVLGFGETILGTDVREGHDPARGPHTYPLHAMPTEQPDLTPTAGTKLTNETVPAYYLTPPLLGENNQPPAVGSPAPENLFAVDLTVPAQVPRVQGLVQVGWIGGDPGVDDPRVTLERYEPTTDTWGAVKTPAGREINDDHADFILAWTPDPLFPSEAEQTHYWWVIWQATNHIHDRAGLALGTYRLHIQGHHYAGGSTTWPWAQTPYEVFSDPFEVTPAPLTLEAGDGGVWASLHGPEQGFRLIDIDGKSRGANPLRGDVTVTWTVDGAPVQVTAPAPDPVDGRVWLPFPAGSTPTGAVVTDVYGNSGTLSFGG